MCALSWWYSGIEYVYKDLTNKWRKLGGGDKSVWEALNGLVSMKIMLQSSFLVPGMLVTYDKQHRSCLGEYVVIIHF